MPQQNPDAHERSAAGQDFDSGDPIREGAAAFGAKIVEEGPSAIFDEIENLIPETWRGYIGEFPFVAIGLGVGVGVWLGMKKSDEVIAAATTLISTAALGNVSEVMDRLRRD